MIGSVFAALALSSLPLIFVSADNQPASLNLPPFEKEVYLSVTAKWAANDCVDITTVTNLPKDAVFVVAAQRRPRKPRPYRPLDRLVDWHTKIALAATAEEIDLHGVFCGLTEARRHGGELDTNGLLLALGVDETAHSLWNLPHVQAEDKQSRRVGRYGALLRGPLASPRFTDNRIRTTARSKTFILEPLPLLPENEDTEQIDEAGVDSE